MSSGRAPLALARAGIDAATRLLPSPAARARYRAQLAAEPHQLSAAARMLFVVGLLSRVLALRAALTARPDRAEEGAASPPAGRWRCRVLRSHVWVLHSAEDGGRYEACRRCGVDRGPVGFGPLTTPPWPGSR